MIEQLKTTYTNYRWAKVAVFVGLLCCGVLLYWLSGGFPPWAWRFLFQVLPQMPHLWEVQGAAILIPFIGLLLLSISLLLIWAILLPTLVRVVIHWWQDFHERQHFAMDLRAVERIVERITVPDPQRERQATPAALPRAQHAALHESASAQQSAIAPRSIRVSHNLPRSIGELQATGTSSTFSLPATQAPHKRRVHIPPLPPMREQLRLVTPPREDELDDELMEVFDDEEYDDLRDSISEQETVPEQEVYWDDELDEAESEEEEDEPEEERSVYSELDEPTLPAIRVTLPPEEEPCKGGTRLVVGAGLDAGLLRKDAPNEDNLCAVQGTRITGAGPEEVGLFVVADGMGGHAHGQEASKLAIQTMSDVLVPTLLHGGEDEENFLDLLKDGVHRANLAIYRRNREREEMMGTTLTAALVVHTTAYVVNVGDSRTYLYRQADGLQAITRDHSLVARMVESGAISREEMYTHPRRNQVYRCLGERATVEVDTFVVTLQAGDLLLLCSDGLWEMVRDEKMSEIISSALPHAAQISATLVQAALSEGGADNVSVITVYVAQGDE
ncbi:MAG TPA: protein phosphatase 2C domain-containing protein [Ktedonosporobacter sp.]|jgi:serine/threonine protein phosphatase PrpC|nr:protein phosphatase 2C domain-containing protein [Ktedonosporobacter sp.]